MRSDIHMSIVFIGLVLIPTIKIQKIELLVHVFKNKD